MCVGGWMFSLCHGMLCSCEQLWCDCSTRLSKGSRVTATIVVAVRWGGVGGKAWGRRAGATPTTAPCIAAL
jgi:hypothetical protein